jgi:hypothetical protein
MSDPAARTSVVNHIRAPARLDRPRAATCGRTSGHAIRKTVAQDRG